MAHMTSKHHLSALLALSSLTLPAAAFASPLLMDNAQIQPEATAQAAPAAPYVAPERQLYTLESVNITGQKRIETNTIRSYLGLREGQSFYLADVDAAIKRLFETGFFQDMRAQPVQTVGNQVQLNISVLENPLINRVAFEGNKGVDDEDLEAELELKSRSIFTRAKVQSDTKRILDLYRRKGKYSARVEPKMVTLDDNRVDLVYEIEEGPEALVRDIRFIGNEQFTSSQLRDAVMTEETAWYKFLSSSDTYDQDRLQYDQELLRRFYLKQGYADFKIKSAVAELNPAKDSFFITFTIEEGEQYNIGNVMVVSKIADIDSSTLSSKLTVHDGEVYNASEVENTVDAIVNELGDKGFAFVNVTPDLDRDAANRTIDVAFNIAEGPKVYVERIDIKGNARTLDEVVRREFRLAEGDPYSTTKLQRTEQRLKNLGFFGNVALSNKPGSAPDRTVIDVDVEEKSTGQVSLGGGFSSVDGPLIDFGISEANLLGRGQNLKLRAMLSGLRQQYDIGFTEPYFLGRDISAGVDLFNTALDYRQLSAFDRENSGGRLRLGYSINEKLRHSFNYTLQDVSISNVRPNASIYVRQQEGTYLTSSVGQTFTYDTRNSRFTPTDGTVVNFNQDFAGLGGDIQYLRHEVSAAHYESIAPKWTFLLGGMVGHAFGVGQNLRINDRFFIGQQEIRGFDIGGIGPRDVTTDDALGGNSYFATTAELQFPMGLPDDLGISGAAFVDAANLWGIDSTGPGIVDSNTIRASAGVGVAWASPFGPIRVDFAVPFLKQDEDITQNIRFSFGTTF